MCCNAGGVALSYHQITLPEDHHCPEIHAGEFLAEETFFAGAAARSELALAANRARIAGAAFGRHWSWEILLTIFAAGCAGEAMSLSAAIGRLGAPYEFARRLVGVMINEGSIRTDDERLGDDSPLSVTDHVFTALRCYLREPGRQAFAI